MKFLFSLLALVLTVNECGHSKTQSKLSKAELYVDMNSKEIQQDYTITYSATSRGFFKEITIENSSVVIKNTRNDKGTEMKLSNEEKKDLYNILSDIRLETLPYLKAPTQKRFYDGAPHATLSITVGEKTYETESFDHGYPPKAIEALCEKILSFDKDEKESKFQKSDDSALIGSYNVTYMSDFKFKDFESKELTIVFKGNGTVSGFNGCNGYKANVQVIKDSISIGMIMSTKRYCQDPLEIEGNLMAKLQSANRFIIQGNTLTLLDNNEVLIKAEKKIEKE